MIEGNVVTVVGALPKGMAETERTGTLLWSFNKKSAVLMSNGLVFVVPSYEVILEQGLVK